ncbi:MAG: hypothetical protein OXT67_09140 [Zetaproteobacteria bacterium]|nr:hypothetical protein [Zetaproteobacteria bacterium]
MKKVWLLFCLISSMVGFSKPSQHLSQATSRLEIFAQQDMDSATVPQVKVGDTVKVQTTQGWKIAKVAKVAASGMLFVTLVQGSEAGPAATAACGAVCAFITKFGCGVSAGFLTPFLSPVGAALYHGVCQMGTSQAAVACASSCFTTPVL